MFLTFGCFDCVCFVFFGFSDFSLYGSWEAGNVCKRLLAGLGVFPDIGESLLRTLIFRFFFEF